MGNGPSTSKWKRPFKKFRARAARTCVKHNQPRNRRLDPGGMTSKHPIRLGPRQCPVLAGIRNAVAPSFACAVVARAWSPPTRSRWNSEMVPASVPLTLAVARSYPCTLSNAAFAVILIRYPPTAVMRAQPANHQCGNPPRPPAWEC